MDPHEHILRSLMSDVPTPQDATIIEEFDAEAVAIYLVYSFANDGEASDYFQEALDNATSTRNATYLREVRQGFDDFLRHYEDHGHEVVPDIDPTITKSDIENTRRIFDLKVLEGLESL